MRPCRLLRQLPRQARHRTTRHPIIRSYEPDEDWYFCYPDDLMFELADAPPNPSHP